MHWLDVASIWRSNLSLDLRRPLRYAKRNHSTFGCCETKRIGFRQKYSLRELVQFFVTGVEQPAIGRVGMTSKRGFGCMVRELIAWTMAGWATTPDCQHLAVSEMCSAPTIGERIQTAYGTAKKSAELEESLSALQGLGKELPSHIDPGIGERRKDSGRTTPLLEQLGKLAKDVKLLGGADQAAREISVTSQVEVDLWDVVNLLLRLEPAMSLINPAHELEPSIPCLRTSPCAPTYFHSGPQKRPFPRPYPTDGLRVIVIGAHSVSIKTVHSSH